jgi:hypothetical protein
LLTNLNRLVQGCLDCPHTYPPSFPHACPHGYRPTWSNFLNQAPFTEQSQVPEATSYLQQLIEASLQGWYLRLFSKWSLI